METEASFFSRRLRMLAARTLRANGLKRFWLLALSIAVASIVLMRPRPPERTLVYRVILSSTVYDEQGSPVGVYREPFNMYRDGDLSFTVDLAGKIPALPAPRLVEEVVLPDGDGAWMVRPVIERRCSAVDGSLPVPRAACGAFDPDRAHRFGSRGRQTTVSGVEVWEVGYAVHTEDGEAILTELQAPSLGCLPVASRLELLNEDGTKRLITEIVATELEVVSPTGCPDPAPES
jgi:hypothetical protein